ncbi:hypothetical protein Daus18300_006265 [Diaporthe australafricana]|uniref:C2H2-type domain-containing protein n=1 Tax=Diaporthe australafricana TaxID=127596 RepID=A0ABR3WWK7_9PEZI
MATHKHAVECELNKRPGEPSSKTGLTYTLMRWYIPLREQGPVADKWPCPLQFCIDEYGTFDDMIGHLDNCPHIKPGTRQYTYICPACDKDIQVSAIGYSKKTLGKKIKKSLEDLWSHSNMLGRPTSATSSRTLGAEQVLPISPSLGAAPFEMEGQAPTFVNPKENIRNIAMPPIDTQMPRASTYGVFPNDICPSALTSNSSSLSASDSAISQCFSLATSFFPQATEPSSALVSTPASSLGDWNMSRGWSNMQPSYGLGQGADLNCYTPFPETSADDLVHGVVPMDGITPSLLVASDEPQAEQFQDEYPTILQDQWSQRGEFSQFSPIDSPQDDGFVLEVAGSDVPSSPVPSSSTTSEAALSPAGGSTPECKECQWKPEAGARSMKRMKQAVQKHIKRNHESQDYYCPVCYQPFKNRPDNVKPHVFRKHRLVFDSIYPKTVQDGYRDERKEKTTGAVPNRRASVPSYISHPLPRQRRRLQRRSC